MESQAKVFIKHNDIRLLTYDYSRNTYKKILQEAYKEDLQQVIFTTTLYKKIIKKVFEEDFYLISINFMDYLDEEDFIEIKNLIEQINNSNGNSTLIKLLLKEIDWFVNNESVDIKSISILDNSSRNKIELFNNGVLICEQGQLNKVKTRLLDTLQDNT